MIKSELEIFIWLTLTGILLAFLFDGYHLAWSRFKPRLWITAATDLTFWLAAAFLVFIVLLLNNWGEMRLYIFIALGGGVAIYYQFFVRQARKWLTYSMRLLFRLEMALAGLFRTLVFYPVCYFLRAVAWPFRLVRGPLQRCKINLRCYGQKIWRKVEKIFK